MRIRVTTIIFFFLLPRYWMNSPRYLQLGRGGFWDRFAKKATTTLNRIPYRFRNVAVAGKLRCPPPPSPLFTGHGCETDLGQNITSDVESRVCNRGNKSIKIDPYSVDKLVSALLHFAPFLSFSGSSFMITYVYVCLHCTCTLST